MLGTMISAVSRGFFYNGWSDVVTQMLQVNPEYSKTELGNIIPQNIYYQILPFKACILSFVFMLLYLYMIGSDNAFFHIVGEENNWSSGKWSNHTDWK